MLYRLFPSALLCSRNICCQASYESEVSNGARSRTPALTEVAIDALVFGRGRSKGTDHWHARSILSGKS